jgi:hypothetical protein
MLKPEEYATIAPYDFELMSSGYLEAFNQEQKELWRRSGMVAYWIYKVNAKPPIVSFEEFIGGEKPKASKLSKNKILKAAKALEERLNKKANG